MIFRGALTILTKISQLSWLLFVVKANIPTLTICLIMLLSVLLILSTRLATYEYIFAKNNNIDQTLLKDNICRYHLSEIDSLCQDEKLNIPQYNTGASEPYSLGDSENLVGTFLKQYDKDRAQGLAYHNFSQNHNVSNQGNVDNTSNIMPAFVGGGGNGPGSGPGSGRDHFGDGGGGNGPGSGPGSGRDHFGDGGGGNGPGSGRDHFGDGGGGNGPGSGGGHDGNNHPNNGNSNNGSCVPVTLSGLPGQNQPIAICLVTGKATNVATQIGYASFTLVNLNNGEFKLTVNGLNGQTQPAIVTVSFGVTSPIIVPGLGTGNVLIGDTYSIILDMPRIFS